MRLRLGGAARVPATSSRAPTATSSPARAALVASAVVALALGVTGCGAAAQGSGKALGRHTVVVLAASSLTESLTAIAADFEASHPGTDVQLSFAASSTVVAQVNAGAPADLIALAGTSAAGSLDRHLIAGDTPRTLARNTLEIATPPGNPGHVATFADLARPALKVVLCAATVPCGKAAAKALSLAGIKAHIVSYETDVKATLAKVRLGEADAAIVYYSDVVSAHGKVRGVPIPASVNQSLAYPLFRLSADPATAQLMTYLLSDKARVRLRDNGFAMP